MKKYRTIIYILSILAIFYSLNIIFDRHFTKSAINGKHNVFLARQLKMGLDENTLIKTMGTPYRVVSNPDFSKIYHYKSNNVDYLDIEITIDKNKSITRVFIPEN